jgi:hypothetical protein
LRDAASRFDEVTAAADSQRIYLRRQSGSPPLPILLRGA